MKVKFQKTRNNSTIIFEPSRKEAEVAFDISLLEQALALNLPIGNSCGGMGTCGTCRVIVTEGLETLAPRGEVELEFANDRGFHSNERLACQICATQGIRVKIP